MPTRMPPRAERRKSFPASTFSTNRQVAGITCITPQAPVDEVTFQWKPDSIHATARTSRTLTP